MIICTYTDRAVTKQVSPANVCMWCLSGLQSMVVDDFVRSVRSDHAIGTRCDQETISIAVKRSGGYGTALKRCRKEAGGPMHHTSGYRSVDSPLGVEAVNGP